jgi:hypothetical protein
MIDASVTPRPDRRTPRDQRRQVAGVGQRADEGIRVGARGVELAPVAVGKRFAEIADRGSQVLMKIVVDTRRSSTTRQRLGVWGQGFVQGLGGRIYR